MEGPAPLGRVELRTSLVTEAHSQTASATATGAKRPTTTHLPVGTPFTERHDKSPPSDHAADKSARVKSVVEPRVNAGPISAEH